MHIFRLLFSRRWWWTTLLVLAAIAVTFRLGIWQVDRYHQNKAAADHLAQVQAAPPLQVQGNHGSEGLLSQEYRQAQAMGTYDFSRQVVIRNQVWVQNWGAQVGYILITPLMLPDGSAVLVDRGWIPAEDSTPASWRQFDQPGEVTVNGILRLSTRSELGGVPEPTLAPGETHRQAWNKLDLPRLQAQFPYPLLPFYIQESPDPAVTTMPYRSTSTPDLLSPGTNVGYAGTWFAFSLLLIGGYPLYLNKQAKH